MNLFGLGNSITALAILFSSFVSNIALAGPLQNALQAHLQKLGFTFSPAGPIRMLGLRYGRPLAYVSSPDVLEAIQKKDPSHRIIDPSSGNQLTYLRFTPWGM